MRMTRREFVLSSAAAALGGCATPVAPQGQRNACGFIWGELIHFGVNCWHDHPVAVKDEPWFTRQQNEALARMVAAADHVRFDEEFWRRFSGKLQISGVNLIVVDVAEILRYPSHPEIAVAGSWSPEKLAGEIARLRDMGFEVVPKLNFSTTHDVWLGPYHRMVGTARYYEVVSDLISDVCEVFGGPRLFHLGLDEEIVRYHECEEIITVRSREKWWKDLYFYQREVERHGARAWIFSDFFRRHESPEDRKEFVRKMPKDILQNPWWYQGANRPPFDPARWPAVRCYLALSELGYDYVMCCSNCTGCPQNMEDTVAFCRSKLDVSHCRGFLMAPWVETNRVFENLFYEGADQVARSRASWEAGA